MITTQLLNARHLSPADFKQAKTLSNFDKSNYKWNRSTKLYDKLNLIKKMDTKTNSKENATAEKKVPTKATVKATKKVVAKTTKKVVKKPTVKKVGVIASIYEFLGKRPQSTAQIAARLLKRFPEKNTKSLTGTINCQIGSEKGRAQHPAKQGYKVEQTIKGKGKDKVKSYTGQKIS